MKLELIIQVARESGFKHKCTGISFEKIDGKQWTATLHSRGDPVLTNPHGTGDSTREATDDVVSELVKWIADKQERALRDKTGADALLMLLSSGVTEERP